MKTQSNPPPTAIIMHSGEPAVHDLPKCSELDTSSTVPKARQSRTDPAVYQFLALWIGCGLGIALATYLCLHFLEPTCPYGAWLLLIMAAVALVAVAAGIADGAIKPHHVENRIIGRWKLEIGDRPWTLFLRFYANGFLLIEKQGVDNDDKVGRSPATRKPAIVSPAVEEVFFGCSSELAYAIYSCPDDHTIEITVETTGQKYTERIISVKTGYAGELVMTIENMPRRFHPVCGSEQSIWSLVASTLPRQLHGPITPG